MQDVEAAVGEHDRVPRASRPRGRRGPRRWQHLAHLRVELLQPQAELLVTAWVPSRSTTIPAAWLARATARASSSPAAVHGEVAHHRVACARDVVDLAGLRRHAPLDPPGPVVDAVRRQVITTRSSPLRSISSAAPVDTPPGSGGSVPGPPRPPCGSASRGSPRDSAPSRCLGVDEHGCRARGGRDQGVQLGGQQPLPVVREDHGVGCSTAARAASRTRAATSPPRGSRPRGPREASAPRRGAASSRWSARRSRRRWRRSRAPRAARAGPAAPVVPNEGHHRDIGPMAARFAATLPAPRRSSSLRAARTGIGASGEIRATSPTT